MTWPSTRTAVSFAAGLGVALTLVAACTSAGAAPPPPPPLNWIYVSATPKGGTISTACTPWGDRLYAGYATSGETLAAVPYPASGCLRSGPGPG